MIASLKKLKYTSLFNELRNNYFIGVCLIILLALILKNFNIIILLILLGYLIYILIKNKKIFFCFLIILGLFLTNYLIRRSLLIKENDYYDDIAKVEQIKKLDDSYQITFKLSHTKAISYFDEELPLGAWYHLQGNLEMVSPAHYEGGFDYQSYLQNKGISGQLKVDSYEFIKKGFNIYILNYLINRYFDNHYHTSSISLVKALTIGNKNDMNEELIDDISNIGISHLFVISGLHVNLIATGLLFLLKKLKLKEKKQNIITIIILIVYYLLSGLLISVLRVVLGFILRFINKSNNYDLKGLDLMAINIIIVLLINPLYIYQYSFILSYLISTTLIICQNLLKVTNKKLFFLSSLKISLIATLVSLPVASTINPTVNFLAIIYNLFYIPLVTYLMLPLSLITIMIPPFENLFNYVFLFFSKLTSFLANIKLFSFNFPTINILLIFLYYGLLYFLLRSIEKKKINLKVLISLIFFIIMWNNINFLNIYNDVYFVDLPKGEATLIKASFNRCNILIDTGEDGYDDILLFLKKQGIKRLDLIIISHPDSDHNGMLEEIISDFKVKNVYYGQYDNLTKTKINPKINHQSLRYNDQIKINNLYFQVISPAKDYHNTNDNSLVLIGNIFGKNYLFTGDISQKVERDLFIKQEIDILKIAHHGSSTSTSDTLLQKINFLENTSKIAICMNGYRNQFSFPSLKIVEKIKKQIYVTSYTKTIRIRKIFNHYQISYKK